VWTAGLAAAIAFTGLEIRAVSQTQKPPSQQTAPPATSKPATPATPQTAPPRTGGQGANQGAPATSGPQGPGGRGPQIGPRLPGGARNSPPWWQDEAVRKELALTAEQIKQLDSIYERRAKDLEPLTAELDKQVAELNRLMSDREVGVAAISLQVARLEVPRAKINESFYVMMYRMSRVLNPEQNKKLQAIFDRNRDRDRGRGGH